MSKLLSKPFKAFTVYALIVLICSIPAYYLAVESIWIEELDEHNLIIKHRIENEFKNKSYDEKEIAYILNLWNAIQPGTSLILTDLKELKADSIYTEFHAVTLSTENEEDRFRCLSTYIELNKNIYHLKIERNVEEVDETLLSIALVTILFFSILIIGFIILNRIISKKIWKPFNTSLKKLKEFDISKHQQIEFEKSTIEEFDELNTSLESLIKRSTSIFNQQRTFIENASHELQTPLAVLKSKLEMLLQNESFNKEQLVQINAIQKPVGRISRINKNLLLLAKIENNQFEETEQNNLVDLVKENLDLLEDYFSTKEINLLFSATHELKLICNKFLLEILINNLIINTITHSNKGANVDLQIVGNDFIIRNSGQSALKHENLFKRFETASNKESSSGLGLSIVNEICKRYSWEITYDFNELNHVFRIRF